MNTEPSATPEFPERNGQAGWQEPQREPAGPTAANGQAPRTCYEAALEAHQHGINTIPIREDGSKRPAVSTWKPFQTELMTREQLDEYFGPPLQRKGISVITGRDLELLEHDTLEVYQAYKQAAQTDGLGEIVERIEAGYLEESPGGGFHWLYRCSLVQGNTKLAGRIKRPEEYTAEDAEKVRADPEAANTIHKTLIETRGNGGYVIIAPSCGSVHETGRPYRMLRGGFPTIATITPEERAALLDLARSFDQLPQQNFKPPRDYAPSGNGSKGQGGLRPGDDYNARVTYQDWMNSYKFTYLRSDPNRTEYWRRPGKENGSHSVTANRNGSGRIYSFSSSLPLPLEKACTPFEAEVFWRFGGDFKAAARALRAAGYGSADQDRARGPGRPLSNLEAIAAADRVIVAPSATAADLLTRLGFVATASGHGAPKHTDWSPLRGKTTVIVPNRNDAGQRDALEAASRLRILGCTTIFLDIPGEEGEGLEQWVQALRDQGQTDEEIHDQLATLVEVATRSPAEDLPLQTSANSKRSIEVTTVHDDVCRETLKALAADPDLYRAGALLVLVVESDADVVTLSQKTTIKGLKGVPRRVPLDKHGIRRLATRWADYYKWSRPGKGQEPKVLDVSPPEYLGSEILAIPDWPGIRELQAIAECPFPREDGSLVTTPGYDPLTKTLYQPSQDFLDVPENPSQDDARNAWKVIYEPFKQFPFQSEPDKAAFLAALLTVIARPGIPGPVPGFIMNGNKAGTGKGNLINAIGIIAHGRAVPVSSYPDDDIEAQKVKVALALAGTTIVHFDNIADGGTYGGSALDSAITAMEVDDRILGSSQRTGRLPIRPTWFGSGNRIVPAKDAYRRWIPSHLKTEEEFPEERTDLEIERFLQHIRENRAELVQAALTILRAHTLAGRPRRKEKGLLGSFEDWDIIVAGAVKFATGHDCLTTQKAGGQEAPERGKKLALLEGWLELPAGSACGMTARDAVQFALEHQETCPTLYAALLEFGKDGKPADSGTIGHVIRGLRGNTMEGKSFEENGKSHQAVRWIVQIHPAPT